MKIHLTGTHWQGATTDNIQKCLEGLGHEVLFFDKHLSRNWRIAKNLALRTTRHPYKVENYFFEASSRHWFKSLEAFKPDLIILEDATNILATYIERARSFGRPIFYYEVSPPHGSGSRDMLMGFKYVDETFCIDREWAKLIEMFFPKKVHHLPLAGNPDDFYPIPDEKKIYDVAMVASAPEQSPDGLIRANLINSIPDNLCVGIFGSGWGYWTRYFPKLKARLSHGEPPSTAEVNHIYNQSKILINYHSTGHTTSISSRTFEIALSGGFQITDYRDDFALLFPKDFFPVYGDIAQMNEKIADWLPRESERKRQAERAREYVREHHTWRHRVGTILEVYKKNYQ